MRDDSVSPWLPEVGDAAAVWARVDSCGLLGSDNSGIVCRSSVSEIELEKRDKEPKA